MSGGEVPGRHAEATPPTPLRPLLVTHSGTFHLDDAFAYAVLRTALDLREPDRDHALVRTRDGSVIMRPAAANGPRPPPPALA